MSEATVAPPSSDAGTIDVLKQIKATEAEWDGRVARARRESDAVLQRLRDERDATVAAAHAQAETERARTLADRRATADAEAAEIVAEGETAARAATSAAGKRPADRKDEVLRVVLGSFASD